MELKPRRCARKFSQAYPFNRTTMELKPVVIGSDDEHILSLLIEPLWNWNLPNAFRTRANWYTFNRTTMELKPPIRARYDQKRLAFNRTTMELKRRSCPNSRWHSAAFNRTTMELKHWPYCSTNAERCAFNRTTMELKPIPVAGHLANRWLLIEPLWNWNNSHKYGHSPTAYSFNRTTMELKPIYGICDITVICPFNRTTMELKLGPRAREKAGGAYF